MATQPFVDWSELRNFLTLRICSEAFGEQVRRELQSMEQNRNENVADYIKRVTKLRDTFLLAYADQLTALSRRDMD